MQIKEKTDDFFVQNRQNPFSFPYTLSIDKKSMYVRCSGKRIVQFSSYAFALDAVGLLGFDLFSHWISQST